MRAVNEVSFSVEEGTIRGLIGPNGSGKTTTFNLISGLIAPDAGSVLLSGREIVGRPPHEIVRLGLVRTFQQIRLFAEMSALENVLAAGAQAPQARALLARVGVTRQNVAARRLGFLEQHLVEIARALATQPRILLLDEPSTGMIASEVETLEALIRGLRDEGMTIVIVEHNMRLVMQMCERITVMDAGRVIAEGMPKDIASNPAVIAAYLGEDADGVA